MTGRPPVRQVTRWAVRWLVPVAGVVFALLFGDRLRLSRSRPDRIRFAHTYTTESERAILDRVIARFEADHPGVRVEQSAANSEVYNSVGWRLQFQGRTPPDVYFHWQGFKVRECIARGWALDVRPYLSPGFLGQLVPSALGDTDGPVHFLPHSVDVCNVVWYNRDLLARAGGSEPATFAEWLATCRQLRAAGVLPLVQGNRDLWPMGNFAMELAGQSLGAGRTAALFAAGADVTADAPTALGGLEALREAGAFHLEGVLAPGAVGEMGDIDAKVLFLGGRSAMHVLGSWFLADIEDARSKGQLGFEVGLFPVPAQVGETDALAAVTTGYLVNPRTANPRLAVELVERVLSREVQAEFAALGTLSTRRDAREFTTDPLAREMLDILAAVPVVVPPPDTGFRPDQADAFYQAVARLLAGRLSFDDLPGWWQGQKADLARKGL